MLFDNSSVNFRAQWTFKKKIPTIHFLHIQFLLIYFCSTPRFLEFCVTQILSSKSSGQTSVPPGIVLQKSPMTLRLPKNFENQILKSSKSSGQGSAPPPPRNSSTKNPYIIFHCDQNPKSYDTSKLPKNFQNQILKSFKSSGQSSVPPGIVLQKSHITFFSDVKIQKDFGLQSYPKILKIKCSVRI